MDLSEFLLARIAEDERAAERAVQWRTINGFAWMGPTPEEATALCISGHRLLAECEAKRSLIERVGNPDWAGFRILATVYADHPDYQPEWRPAYV